MFHFSSVLGIHLSKTHSDKLCRFINRFRLRKYQTSVFVLTTVKMPEYNRITFLVSKFLCNILSRSKPQKHIHIFRMGLSLDKRLEHIFQLIARRKQPFYRILDRLAYGKNTRRTVLEIKEEQ